MAELLRDDEDGSAVADIVLVDAVARRLDRQRAHQSDDGAVARPSAAGAARAAAAGAGARKRP